MKRYWRLYLRELQCFQWPIITLGALGIMTGILGFFEEDRVSLALLPLIGILAFPFLLSQSYQTDWHSKSYYLLLSLPIPRWSIGLTKALAILSIGAWALCCSWLSVQIITWRYSFEWAQLYSWTAPIFGLDYGESFLQQKWWFWGKLSMVYLSMVWLLAGIVTFTQSVLLVFQRLKRLLAFFLTILSLYLMFEAWPLFSQLVGASPEFIPWNLLAGFMTMIGSFYVLLGVVIFSNYMEL